MGSAGELTGLEQIYGYMRALAESSLRVHLEEIGRTEEEREILLVAVADEEGIRDLERLKAATTDLADPRTTDPERAEEIIAGARPVYYINAGLHADETGGPETAMELAYRLAVSDQPMIRRIRERLVVLINPVSNPDGRAKMVDWYHRYLKGGTDYDALERFVEEGGVLMTLGNGSTLVLDGGMVRNVRRSTGAGVSTPGVELMARFPDPGHPFAYGYADTTSVFRANYPAYDLPRRWPRMAYCTACLDGSVDTRGVVLHWGTTLPDAAGQVTSDSAPMVVSGDARNEHELQGRPAILAVPRGEGLIVAYNFNPMHRDLNRSDCRLLWNGILNWQSLKRWRRVEEN